MTKTNTTTANDQFYTAYIVREANSRRFLTRPTYSGRVRGVWDRIENAHVFYLRNKAASCASNINHRRPDGSTYRAEVREVQVKRLAPRRARG